MLHEITRKYSYLSVLSKFTIGVLYTGKLSFFHPF